MINLHQSEFEGTDVTFGPTAWFTKSHNAAGPCWGIGFHFGRWLLSIQSANQ